MLYIDETCSATKLKLKLHIGKETPGLVTRVLGLSLGLGKGLSRRNGLIDTKIKKCMVGETGSRL